MLAAHRYFSTLLVVYFIAFLDKSLLGNSAVLGLKTDAHLSDVEYNWLGTIYFISYIIFEYPQNLAFQRFPVGKWLRSVTIRVLVLHQSSDNLPHLISFNVFLMSLAMIFQAACKNFAGLFVLRFIVSRLNSTISFWNEPFKFYHTSARNVRMQR